jgi:CBS domain-containing protein
MAEEKIDAIPVVRGLHLVGLVTSTDLLRLLVQRDEARPLPFNFRLVEDAYG